MADAFTKILFRSGGTLEIALPPHEVIRQLRAVTDSGQLLSLVTLRPPNSTKPSCLISAPDIVAIGQCATPKWKSNVTTPAG